MSLERRNRRVALSAFAAGAAMIGLSYASVPLYRLFCEATGFAGTTQRAETAPGAAIDRSIVIRFDANTAASLGWRFGPSRTAMTVKLGEVAMAAYHAANLRDRETVGTAVFNVTPPGAGQYFNKVECFCFTEQRLGPRQTAEMPVQFFVDPALADDPDVGDLQEITLSYTMYAAGEPQSLSALSRD